MEKIIERNLLFDFYGELLTNHQKEIYEDAVYGDLSLSELAESYGISRQGVHDLIKRCDKILMGYEDKLHLINKFMSIKELTENIKTVSKKELDSEEKLNEILEISDKIFDLC